MVSLQFECGKDSSMITALQSERLPRRVPFREICRGQCQVEHGFMKDAVDVSLPRWHRVFVENVELISLHQSAEFLVLVMHCSGDGCVV